MGGIMDILMIAVVGIGGFMLFRSMNQQQQPPQIITVPAPDPVAPAETVPVEPTPVATEPVVTPVEEPVVTEGEGGEEEDEGGGEDEDEDEDEEEDDDDGGGDDDNGANTKEVNKDKAARDATTKRVNEMTKQHAKKTGTKTNKALYASYRSRSGPRKMHGYYYY